MQTHGILCAAALAFLAPALIGRAHAQEAYPTRTVRIVVPAAPGSTTDTLARIMADALAKSFAKPVIVENVAGGAMNAGATAVAHAAPDGYTLMVAPPAPLAFNDLLYRDLAYRPSAFVPITLLAKIPNIPLKASSTKAELPSRRDKCSAIRGSASARGFDLRAARVSAQNSSSV